MTGLAAFVIHAGAMILARGVVALPVYEVLGLGILRRAWSNFGWDWAFAGRRRGRGRALQCLTSSTPWKGEDPAAT